MKSAGSIQRTGEQSFKLVVCAGTGDDGKRIRKTKNVKVTGGTAEAQERDAKRQLALFLSEVERGKTASGGNMLLKNFFPYWRENYALPNHEKTTIAANDFLFARIDAALGHKKLSQIKPEHILLFLKNLAEPGVKNDPNANRRKKPKEPVGENKLSSNSIKKHLALLSSLFSQAERWGMVHANPCKRVTPPKVERKSPRIYDEETLARFLAHLETEPVKHRLMVSLALTGGLRREEIFGLRWKDVSFSNATVVIRQASVYIPGEIVTKAPKTTGSARTISLPPSTMALLTEHQREQAAEQKALGDKWITSDRVFTKWNGEPAHPHSFGTWLTRFTKKHGLPHISPHNFRHMNATYLIVAGTDIRTVAGKLGHSKTSTTVNVYAQYVQAAEKETANTMESFLQGLQRAPEKEE